MDKERREKILRLVLRSIPLVGLPGPELYDLFQDLTRSRTLLDKKVEEALASIKKASLVISELEGTLTERTSKLEALRSEVERISKIAAVDEKNAAPVLREIEALVSKGRTRERIVAFVINIAAGGLVFLAGAYFGPRLFRTAGPSAPPPAVTRSTSLAPGQGKTKQSPGRAQETEAKPKSSTGKQ